MYSWHDKKGVYYKSQCLTWISEINLNIRFNTHNKNDVSRCRSEKSKLKYWIIFQAIAPVTHSLAWLSDKLPCLSHAWHIVTPLFQQVMKAETKVAPIR
jgi:hypothetical protein